MLKGTCSLPEVVNGNVFLLGEGAVDFGAQQLGQLPPQLDRLRRERVARPRPVDRNNVFDPPGAGGAHDDPVGERHRFVDVMGDENDYRASQYVFTTRREAKPSCVAVRSAGSGKSAHTSRRRTRQSPHARYPPRNLGRNGGTARVGRRKELRCAERGPTLTSNLRAPRTNPASGLDEASRRDRCAGASRQDQLDPENDGG